MQSTQSCKTILTYKNLDKKMFFSIPDRFHCIDDMTKELERHDELKWPTAIGEEHSIERQHMTIDESLPIFQFSASRELSCSLRLDILPSTLVINGLRQDIQLVDLINQQEIHFIRSNYVSVLPSKVVSVSHGLVVA